uniref:EF-hand calcium-binding domain-containing protein 6-like isoform X2 n=1 Tax=Crassostrea virginica TaxID=6565 RepID=A0A8B8ANG9_CRAVI|nr:EF-hand calcium-binding domain-containing protein 6-like isoform X2 [Crassostrea virginica]
MATAGTLLPDTQGVQFTARPAVLRTKENIKPRSGRSSSLSSEGGIQPVNASLSSIEIEAILREKVRAKHQNIMQAFMTYDVEHSLGVTKGEFRRVLESFCLPLTSEQFEAVVAKVEKNQNGTVRYPDFMEKFYGQPPSSVAGGQWAGYQKFSPPPAAREINIDMIEKMLKDKISQNFKAVIKALQLFDYNRDGKIQRHELRRVIENYCFKLTDDQFQKLWLRYDFHHTGLVSYKEFLSRLGVTVNNQNRPQAEGAKGALLWPQQIPASNSKIFKQRRDDEEALQRLNFDQIELEFRNRMRKNYLNLKKIFLTFDRHLDGFISLEDLKSILCQFTVPMSDQLFRQMMERCGVKGTGKISWEQFLDKFQDPQGGGNGQTIPMRPNHKFFPIREGIQVVPTDDIWKLLYKHVQSHYPSLKQAFLQIDATRKGRITRTELRNVIEKFAFRLDNEQFKQLMLKLDPYHTNSISYHDFLKLFEETDTPEGHKWLNSVHRFNETPKPAIMAWETIEEILREKITEYWKPVSAAIAAADSRGDGYVSVPKMKSIIDNCVLPVSEDHFKSMVSRCQDCPNNLINYVEFLEMLNVDVRPGDLIGLSSQIQQSSEEREAIRVKNHIVRATRVNRRAQNRTNTMTADEVITRLKDRMSQHKVQIRQAFLSFDKTGKGRVNKKNFREVLGSFGILMTDEQFKELVERVGFINGYLQYSDFVMAFEDPRAQGPGDEILRVGNHRVNPIRGDEWGMTADEVEAKLHSKLRENFANLRAAFYKFDEDHNGLINKANFRRILDSFMCIISDNEFEELCKRMGITNSTKISYEEFLQRFEVRDTVEGHKWLNSVHRYNSTHPTPAMTAEGAHEALKQKCHRQWKDLAQAFTQIDAIGTKGVLRRRELRDLLFKMVIPMGPEEFKRLWAFYDEDGKGYINYQDFLDKLGASEFAPADAQGTSADIIDNSHQTIVTHNEDQLAKQQRMTKHQAIKVAFMNAEQVERQLRDKIRDSFKDTYDAFRKYDTQKKGSLSVNDVQKVLTDLHFFMDDEQFFRLMDKIGLGTKGSRLNYEEFLRAFEDGRKEHYQRPLPEVRIEECGALSPQEAETKLRQMIETQGDVLGKAFASFDKSQSNLISVTDFRRVLDIFAFKLTEPQWRHLQSRLQMVDKSINYVLFLENYAMSDQEDAEKWLTALQKQMRDQAQTLMPIDEVQERVREAVHAHFYTLANLFKEIDYANIGVISKEDFRDVMDKNVMRFTDEQFDKVWASLPVNDFGNLDYKEFLRRFSSSMELPPTQRPASTMNGRPGTQMSGRRLQSRAVSRSYTQMEFGRPGSRISRAQSRMSTPLINAEGAEARIKNRIFRNWKEIQRSCRNCDKNNTGTIQIQELRDILVRNGITMPDDEFLDLMTKYDLREDGSFAYVDFLRHFILNLKPQDDGNLLSRRRVPQGRVSVPMFSIQFKVSAGHTSTHFYDAMIRLRECVMQNWKEMRRLFRSMDRDNQGAISSLDFRHVLRQFSVNLEEDEFFHLLSYYDKNLNGMIAYNDFIKAYLQHP